MGTKYQISALGISCFAKAKRGCTANMTDFNMLDVRTFEQGHPHISYDRLREDTPVLHHEGSPAQPPFWLLFRYEEIKSVSQDAANFTSTAGFKVLTENRASMDPEIGRALGRFMLAMDNPEHMAYRNLVSGNFMPSAMKTIEPRIQRSIDALMASLDGRDTVEFVTEVGAKVPIQTICAVLGLPPEEEDRVFEFTNAVFGTDDPDFTPSLEVANARYLEIFEYGLDVLRNRRENPQDDLLTRIEFAEIDGEPIGEVEKKSFFSNLLAAGNETTRSTLAGCIWAMAKFPQEKRKLIDDPSLIAGSIDEFLRWVSPVYHMARTAKCDVELGGKSIAKGERVGMLYGAGNHDPAMFEDPHTLNLARPNASRHLSMGWGIHHCLGSRLAAMQLRLFITAFLNRFPNYEVIEPPNYVASNFVAATKSLKVRLNQ